MGTDKSDATEEPSLEAINRTAINYFRSLGRRIAQLRKQHEMSQTDLAILLGLSQQSIYAIERGERRIRIDLLPLVSKTFNVTCDDLLGLKAVLPRQPTDALSPKLARHIEILKELSDGDQRVILRLTEAMIASRL